MPMLVERLVELDVELTLQQRTLEEGDTGDDEIFEVDDYAVTNSEEARTRGPKKSEPLPSSPPSTPVVCGCGLPQANETGGASF